MDTSPAGAGTPFNGRNSLDRVSGNETHKKIFKILSIHQTYFELGGHLLYFTKRIDLGGGWVGNNGSFMRWFKWLNGTTKANYGLEFASTIDKDVEFLDILMKFDNAGLSSTDLFIKLTDPRLYPETHISGHCLLTNTTNWTYSIRRNRFQTETKCIYHLWLP